MSRVSSLPFFVKFREHPIAVWISHYQRNLGDSVHHNVSPDIEVMTSFISLPAEIHRLIQSQCDFPTSLNLKSTCHLLDWRLDDFVSNSKLLKSADVSAWAVERNFWACYGCSRLREAWEFLDTARRGKKFGRYRESRTKRCCVECGLKMKPEPGGKARYNDYLCYYTLFGVIHRICSQCDKFVSAGTTAIGRCRHVCDVCKVSSPTKECIEGESVPCMEP